MVHFDGDPMDAGTEIDVQVINKALNMLINTRQEPPVVQQAPEAHKPVESAATSKISLNDVIEKKSLTDFRKAISLNDWFRFKRDLFKGNEEAINATVQVLNGIGSYEEAIAYLNEHARWDPDDPTAADFIKLLEKRFL